MRLLIFVWVVIGIAVIFGLVYGISALIERNRRAKIKTAAPDDDPQFLRDLAKRLAEEEEKKKSEQKPEEPGDEQ
ncbi:MAG: hypothetical protein RLZZ594_509 [Actinomycetota bacterium]|jgi:uncharacterized iron-regulated membrane protein